MSHPKQASSAQETFVTVGASETLEDRVTGLETELREARTEVERVRRDLHDLRSAFERLAAKSVTTCKKCGTEYDVFRHHYSIGLFDNIVYVKCPKCQTPMPVDPHHGVRPE